MPFDWTLLSPAHSPSPRDVMYIANDKLHNQIVLFGGGKNFITPTDYLQDTWTFDGIDWTQQSPTHKPSKRLWSTLTYDEVNQNVILFGGLLNDTSTTLSDTWKWDGTDWTQLSPAHHPSGRFASFACWDNRNGYILLFGGATVVGGVGPPTVVFDTWKWTGTDWTQLSPVHHPQKRESGGDGMTFDYRNNNVVLFGGADGSTHYNDTWIWDGTDWTQLSPTTHPSGTFYSMSFCLSTNKVVAHGDGSTNLTPLWDGTNWTLFNTAHGTVSDTAAMCIGLDYGSVIMWMGQGSTIWNSNTYYGFDTSFVPPVARPQIYRRL